MTQRLDLSTCEEVQRNLNKSEKFNYESRWFRYRIGISVGDQHAWFELGEGKVTSVGTNVPPDLKFRLVGDDAAWDKLADPERIGGVYRLYREKAVKIEGDVIEALRDLKVVWLLCECLADIWKGRAA